MFLHTNTHVHVTHLTQDFPKLTVRLEPKWANFWRVCFFRACCTSHDPHSRWLKIICSILLFSFDSRTLNPTNPMCFPHRNEDPAKCFVMFDDNDKKQPWKALYAIKNYLSPPPTHVKLAYKPQSCAYLMINLCYFVGVFSLKRSFYHARFTALQFHNVAMLSSIQPLHIEISHTIIGWPSQLWQKLIKAVRLC